MRRKTLLLVIGLLLLSSPLADVYAADITPLQQSAMERRLARKAALEKKNPSLTVRPRTTSRPSRRALIARTSARTIRATARAKASERLDAGRTTSSSTPTADLRALALEVFNLTNAERAKEGLPALTYNNLLEASAQKYAEELRDQNFFSHTGQDGSVPKDRMREAGYGNLTMENCACSSYRVYFGENLAKGQETAAQAIHDWMNSPAHKEAILHQDFEEIGIGIAGKIWVQNFGKIQIEPK